MFLRLIAAPTGSLTRRPKLQLRKSACRRGSVISNTKRWIQLSTVQQLLVLLRMPQTTSAAPPLQRLVTSPQSPAGIPPQRGGPPIEPTHRVPFLRKDQLLLVVPRLAGQQVLEMALRRQPQSGLALRLYRQHAAVNGAHSGNARQAGSLTIWSGLRGGFSFVPVSGPRRQSGSQQSALELLSVAHKLAASGLVCDRLLAIGPSAGPGLP